MLARAIGLLAYLGSAIGIKYSAGGEEPNLVADFTNEYYRKE